MLSCQASYDLEFQASALSFRHKDATEASGEKEELQIDHSKPECCGKNLVYGQFMPLIRG